MISIGVNGVTKEVEIGSTYEQLAKACQQEYDHRIALAVVNGKFRELMHKVDAGAEVTFLTYQDSAGHKAYVRTATMIMMKAIQDVMIEDKPDKVKVEFAIGKGYYISVESKHEVTEEAAKRVEKRMQEIVDAGIPLRKQSLPKDEAVALFAEHDMEDKVNLFRFRRGSSINVYNIDDYYDYYYGYMLPNTGYVEYFAVEAYEGGFILNLPSRSEPEVISEFVPREKLFHTLRQADEWGNKMGIGTVGDLNCQICNGKLNDLILVQEAFQERRIGEIAHEIAERKGVKFVMIAGPSSSGKTTFSHRLSIQLRTHGLTPHPIALDDYFVNREDTPLDENGDYNFECLGALDVELFNADMSKLLAGEEVELPTFNFKTGHREYKGNKKKLGPDDILVIEGIHGLNDKLSYSLPNESKFKIYISALTALNVDEHNRIPTTDGRLLRRMVRDARTRGASAKRTIQMWPSVRRGEEENIFPFQESADAFFNSALIYELAVLKQFAEPLLFSISPEEPEYHEAKRLLKFLEYFLGVSSEHLPNNSIVREFAGGSCFPV